MKQFLTAKEAAAELGLSPGTIRKMIDEMRDHIPERYSRSDIFEGRIVAVRFAALQDWAETKQKLNSGIKPGSYDPIRREAELGISEASPTEFKVDTQEIAKSVAAELLRMFTQTAGGAT